MIADAVAAAEAELLRNTRASSIAESGGRVEERA